MKRTTVLSLNNIKLLTFIRKNFSVLLLTFLFVLGLFIGSVAIFPTIKGTDFACALLNSLLNNRVGGTFFKVFLYDFAFSFSFLFLIYFCGTSVFGFITSPLIIFIRGLYYSLIIALLYSQYALKGIAFNAFFIIPGVAVSTVILIAAVNNSISFSSNLTKLMLPAGQTVCNENLFKNYCIKFALYLLILVIPSLLNSTMTAAFINYFNL